MWGTWHLALMLQRDEPTCDSDHDKETITSSRVLSISLDGTPLLWRFSSIQWYSFQPVLFQDSIRYSTQPLSSKSSQSSKGAQSHLTLCDPMDCVPQAPLSMGFSRQEYWSGLPLPSPRNLPNPRIEPTSPVSPALQAYSLPTEPLKKPKLYWFFYSNPMNEG